MGNERRLDPASSLQALYGFRLRKQRSKAELTQDQLGMKVHVSGKLIGHIETGRRLPNQDISRGLDEIFGLDGYFEELLPHVINQAAVPSWFRQYAELEVMARSIRQFEVALIPGMLQTEAYAREVLRAGQREDRLEQLVSARLERQGILWRQDPLWFFVIVDEGALRRNIGGPDVMREQARSLLAAMAEPHITLQVVPWGVGAYPGINGAFTLLSFDEGSDIGYVEGAGTHGRLIEQPSDVSRLAVLYDLVRAVALPVTESEKLIRTVMESV